MKTLTQYLDKKSYILFLVILLSSKCLYSQNQIIAKIINVKGAYAVINKGSVHGIKVGDIFKVQTPGRDFEYGQISVIKVKSTISAVKLILSYSGYSLKLGDIIMLSEAKIVDELLNTTRQDLTPSSSNLNKQNYRSFDDRNIHYGFNHQRMQIEMKINALKTRKLIDFVGLLSTYGITVIGDIAVGNDIFWGSLIPVIGPFINMAIINEYNSIYPDRDRLLFAISGAVQSFLFIDLLINSAKINRINRQLQFGFNPYTKKIQLALSF